MTSFLAFHTVEKHLGLPLKLGDTDEFTHCLFLSKINCLHIFADY